MKWIAYPVLFISLRVSPSIQRHIEPLCSKLFALVHRVQYVVLGTLVALANEEVESVLWIVGHDLECLSIVLSTCDQVIIFHHLLRYIDLSPYTCRKNGSFRSLMK